MQKAMPYTVAIGAANPIVVRVAPGIRANNQESGTRKRKDEVMP